MTHKDVDLVARLTVVAILPPKVAVDTETKQKRGRGGRGYKTTPRGGCEVWLSELSVSVSAACCISGSCNREKHGDVKGGNWVCFCLCGVNPVKHRDRSDGPGIYHTVRVLPPAGIVTFLPRGSIGYSTGVFFCCSCSGILSCGSRLPSRTKCFFVYE